MKIKKGFLFVWEVHTKNTTTSIGTSSRSCSSRYSISSIPLPGAWSVLGDLILNAHTIITLCTTTTIRNLYVAYLKLCSSCPEVRLTSFLGFALLFYFSLFLSHQSFTFASQRTTTSFVGNTEFTVFRTHHFRSRLFLSNKTDIARSCWEYILYHWTTTRIFPVPVYW